jgi:UDP-3-O-[3-hydroxymyristoyl] N-acetylglucosamine deacetylase
LPFQHTLAKTITLNGVGIHSGQPCRLKIGPAEAGAGINFLSRGQVIPARAEFVVSTRRATVLGANGVEISTVEHGLSALYGLGIDNALIEVEGPELPVMDGSAAPLVKALLGAGKRRLAAEAKVRRLAGPVWVGEKDSLLLAFPAPVLRISCIAAFPGMGAKKKSITLRPKLYAEEIAPARTTVLAAEIEALLAQGLGQGGNRRNVVVLGEDKPLTRLRFPDEPLRHKMLDLIGDLALLGQRLQAHIVALRPGHRLNWELVKKIAAAD